MRLQNNLVEFAPTIYYSWANNLFPSLSHQVYTYKNVRLFTSTVHLVMEELPSKPGVNWRTTEKASMLVTASLVGGEGSTGSTPDCMVATLLGPGPFTVHALTSNL